MSNAPAPWSSARSNIPWDEPGFSRRMLALHLDPSHDAASRSFATIAGQVAWIHDTLLDGAATRILDLGCGPGLYTERLARLGHRCHGVDIGPASIEHAEARARREGLACTYARGDLRTIELGQGYGLVTFLYGEPSVFSPAQLGDILSRAAAALEPGGLVLLEPHTEAGVARIGDEGRTEQQLERGLFLDAPHTQVSEGSFDADAGVSTRHWIVSPADGAPSSEHWAWYQAYAEDDLAELLAASGFEPSSIAVDANLADEPEPPTLHFVIARRSG